MTMRKWTLFLSVYVCLCLLSACGGAAGPVPRTEAPASGGEPSGVQTPPEAPPSLAEDEEPTVLRCRVVDGAEEGNLLLAELDEGLYGGAGVYRLNLESGGPNAAVMYDGVPAGTARPAAVPVYLDGEAAEAADLEDGMTVEISFNGAVAETFPAQFGEVYQIAGFSIGTEENPGGTCYDLCGLYLQVLDDLWKKDPGLNENISLAGLDLSTAPGGLTDSEKAAVAWRFGEMHGVEVVTGTFEELKEQGYFTAEPLGDGAPEGAAFLHWEDGCLFSIKPIETDAEAIYSLPTLFFNAEKWRSSLGAYIFHDCSVGWPMMGTWSGYQVGGEMIS